MKKVQLISFRRSGTNLLKQTLVSNFKLELTRHHIAHNWFDLHTAVMFATYFDVIYIVRDGRDVLCSLFNYLKKTDWRGWEGIDADISSLTISGFLRGESKILDICCPNLRLMFENPALSWALHTEWVSEIKHRFFKGRIFYIKYEDLVSNPEEIIFKLQTRFQWATKGTFPTLVKRLVGPSPRRGEMSGWKNEFSDDDLEYFWNFAGKRMEFFGYFK